MESLAVEFIKSADPGWIAAGSFLLGWVWERKNRLNDAKRHAAAVETFTGLIQRYSEIVLRMIP